MAKTCEEYVIQELERVQAELAHAEDCITAHNFDYEQLSEKYTKLVNLIREKAKWDDAGGHAVINFDYIWYDETENLKFMESIIGAPEKEGEEE